ncbi:MAG: hypothetical protein ABSC55_01450 [Syntrophorhabdales bacterium]|jgi:hypothetical protein
MFRDVLKEGMAAHSFRNDDRSMMSRFVLSLANSTITWFKKAGTLSGEQVADGTCGTF